MQAGGLSRPAAEPSQQSQELFLSFSALVLQPEQEEELKPGVRPHALPHALPLPHPDPKRTKTGAGKQGGGAHIVVCCS